MKLEIRPAALDDTPFILKSWAEFYAHSAYAKQMPQKSFFNGHKKLIKKCLEYAPCLVVCDSKDPSFLQGFCVMENMPEKDVLHFIFVRHGLRGKGIGKELIKRMAKHEELSYSHQGDIKSLWGQWKTKVYDPYLFLGR